MEHGTFEHVDPDGLKELVVAVVELAISDWKTAVKILGKHPKSVGATKTKLDCEIFFKSNHFYALTGVDGNVLLRRLRKDYINGYAHEEEQTHES